MKTIAKVKQELKETEEADTETFTDAKLKKHEKQIKFLKDCVSYLEGEPREEFVSNEAKRLGERLKKIESGFQAWKSSTPAGDYDNDMSKAKSMYNSIMDKSTVTRHLKNINYILA